SYYTHTTSSHPISSSFLSYSSAHLHALPSFPTRRSSDLFRQQHRTRRQIAPRVIRLFVANDARHADTIREAAGKQRRARRRADRSEEHTSELQSLAYLVCRLLLEKKKKKRKT